MKRSDYKPLGDYIALVNERNRDLAITHLVGVSIEKKFIPSIANIIGTNLSPYKIIRHNQFAYGPVTSRNGEKITIALYKDTEDGILSQAYEVFRIKDEEVLMPEYLMLWVQRPEFDRYARFKSHGSVRELFSWEEMCNVMLPVPPIAEQRKIVEQYQTIERRIKNNEALIQKLEATAQALYHHTFVEGIDKENLPEGWRMGRLKDIATITMGQSPEGDTINTSCIGVIFYQGSTDFGFRFPKIRAYTNNANRFAEKGDVLMSVRAPVGVLNVATQKCAIGRGVASIREHHNRNNYLFYLIKSLEKQFKISDDEGTIFGSINKDELNDLQIVLPAEAIINEFQCCAKIIDNTLMLYSSEVIVLESMLKLITNSLVSNLTV